MVRTDKIGVTSVIRDLCIVTDSYTTMIHFFRSNAWRVDGLVDSWSKIVRKYPPICKEEGLTLLVGDGVKQSKEARKMSGVRKLHQESENSSKTEYIFGHMFGGVGVLIGSTSKMFCIPLSLRIHYGVKVVQKWCNDNNHEGYEESHVVQMIQNGYRIAKIMGPSLILLDRNFLWVPALKKCAKCNNEMPQVLHLLTKAKKSFTAYTKPNKSTGKGRPRKKGKTIKLKELFKCTKQAIEEITSVQKQQLILSSLKAIEGYVMLIAIAMGLLQIIAIRFSGDINKEGFRFLKTKSYTIVSEATVACFLRKNIFWLIDKNKKFLISEIIISKRSDQLFEQERDVS